MTAPLEAMEDVLGLHDIRADQPVLFFIGSFLLRSVLVFGTLVVAICVTNFAIIATFIGAVFTVMVSLIFPAFIILKLQPSESGAGFKRQTDVSAATGLSWVESSWNVLLIFVGFFGMVSGVASIFFVN
mmetsp:Transcript_28204/g.68599  ORF Transcript_28204/g.68599 Transcript_28204/m.68599 type:complete len:129 (+) Transcript_28204:1-387(+)